MKIETKDEHIGIRVEKSLKKKIEKKAKKQGMRLSKYVCTIIKENINKD